MGKIKDIVQPLKERIDARSVRERIIITITLLIVLFFVWSSLLMDQQIADIKSIKKGIDGQTSGIASMQIIQQSMTEQLAADPNRNEQLRLERYLGEAERMDKELREQTLEFISPQQMVEVLKDLIRQENGLHLVSLETIEPEDPLADMIEQDVSAAAAKSSSASKNEEPVNTEPSGAYLHTLEMKFTGDYLSAMRYIAQLESLEWRFIWKSLSIQLEEYPVTRVELQLQTLGLTDGWIGV